MSREGNFIKNTGILALGEFCPRFFTVLITPILTSQLTKVEYGQYDLIITISSLLLPMATLQISSAAFRFLINKRNDQEACSEIISTIYLFILGMSLLSGILYYLILGRFQRLIGVICPAYFVANILLITTQQILRGKGNNLLYSICSIIQAIVLLVLIMMLTSGAGTVNLGLLGVMISMLLASLVPTIVGVVHGNIISQVNPKRFSVIVLKKLLAYSLPMVPNNLSSWVLTLSDRLVITSFLGLEANAVYSVANKLPQIINSMQGTFVMAWQENASLAAEDSDKDTYYSRMCDWVYRLLTGVMAGLIMTTPVIWKILIRGEYSQAYFQLPVLYLGMMFSCMSSTLGGIYIAHMKTKSVGLTTMAAAAVNLMIDLLMINRIGIWAGSFSTMISYFVLWLYRMIDIQRFQKVKIQVRTIVGSIVCLSVMAIICFQDTPIFNIINVLLCCIILFVFDREIIIFAIKEIKRRIQYAKRK